MRSIRRSCGFTILEIVITIAIVGTLSVIAMSIFYNTSDSAIENTEKSVAGSIRSGIGNYAAESVTLRRDPLYPDVLDTATDDTASPTNPLFTEIIEVPIMQNWARFLISSILALQRQAMSMIMLPALLK